VDYEETPVSDTDVRRFPRHLVAYAASAPRAQNLVLERIEKSFRAHPCRIAPDGNKRDIIPFLSPDTESCADKLYLLPAFYDAQSNRCESLFCEHEDVADEVIGRGAAHAGENDVAASPRNRKRHSELGIRVELVARISDELDLLFLHPKGDKEIF